MKAAIFALLLVSLTAVKENAWYLDMWLSEFTPDEDTLCYGDYLDVWFGVYTSDSFDEEASHYDESPTNIDWIDELYCFTPVRNRYGKFTDFGKGFVARNVTTAYSALINEFMLVDSDYPETMWDGTGTPDGSAMCDEEDEITADAYDFDTYSVYEDRFEFSMGF